MCNQVVWWDVSCRLWFLSGGRGALVQASPLVISCTYSLKMWAGRRGLLWPHRLPALCIIRGWTLLRCGTEKQSEVSIHLERNAPSAQAYTLLVWLCICLFQASYSFRPFGFRMNRFIYHHFQTWMVMMATFQQWPIGYGNNSKSMLWNDRQSEQRGPPVHGQIPGVMWGLSGLVTKEDGCPCLMPFFPFHLCLSSLAFLMFSSLPVLSYIQELLQPS